MKPGDHAFVRRFAYTHHGIVVGRDEVIHFAGTAGALKANARICVGTLDEFARGGRIEVRSYGERLDLQETVERARSRVGESGYHLVGNNCEHFATWCVTGTTKSRQVGAATVATSLATVGSFGMAAGSSVLGYGSPTAGRPSGPSVMSGLKKTAVVGSGVTGGLATLGLIPGVATVAILQLALRDDRALPDEQRLARRAGRGASLGGPVLGSVGGVFALSALGVTGLSGAGIASGLAAIGGLGGGGMALGALMIIMAPAVAAAALGSAVYLVIRGLPGQRAQGPALA
jgi:hypothetical protein